MNRAVIFGAGGLGRLVQNMLADTGDVRPVAFLDSDWTLHGTTIEGLTVRGGLDEVGGLIDEGCDEFCVAIGEPDARIEIATALLAKGARLISVIHPQASIAHSAHLGQHLIIGPRAIICVNSSVGDHSIIMAGAIVEHDNQLGCGVVLHPAVRLAGGVFVEPRATLGIGACVIPGRRIGAGAVIEPGAVVIRNVPASARAGGVPAREAQSIQNAIPIPECLVRTPVGV